jgi:hypothetical protein
MYSKIGNAHKSTSDLVRRVSLYKNFQYQSTENFKDVVALIKSDYLKEAIIRIRNLFQDEKDKEANELKKQLPAFTASGEFHKERIKEKIIQYNQLVMLDIDDLESDQIETLRQLTNENSYTYCSFLSPSGYGLKICVKVDSESKDHEEAYKQVSAYYRQALNITLDSKCKDVTRLCFLSYDTQLYIHEEAQVFEVLPEKSETYDFYDSSDLELEVTRKESDYTMLFNQALSFTLQKETFKEGNRNNFIHLLACNTNRAGIPLDPALTLIHESEYGYDGKEVETTVKSAYDHNKHEYKKGISYKSYKSDVLQILGTDVFGKEVYESLPEFLKECLEQFKTEREKDVFLSGALGVLSGCIPNVAGYYAGQKVRPNLFILVTAPPSAGKGTLTWAKYLGENIHQFLRLSSRQSQSKYKADLAVYNQQRKNNPSADKPEPPTLKMHFISANVSASAIIQTLEDNDCKGILYSSEADTLTGALSHDWGNFSDMLRKAFHHETVDLLRKTNREYSEIIEPQLSIVLSGTPGQVRALFKDAENGLVSRFVFYAFNLIPEWKNVFEKNANNGIGSFFRTQGARIFNLYYSLKNLNAEIEFIYTDEQSDKFHHVFTQWHQEFYELHGEESLGSARRLGVIQFRIAMILSILRHFETGEISMKWVCRDEDFKTALKITETLRKHAIAVFSMLPRQAGKKISGNKQKFYEVLPVQFKYQEAVVVGRSCGIKVDAVQKYLRILTENSLLERSSHGNYIKL